MGRAPLAREVSAAGVACLSVKKRSADSTAKQYWEAYYGSYGKAMTADIPQRIARLIGTRIKTASAAKAGPQYMHIAPISVTPLVTGGHVFEGIFRGTTVVEGKPEYTYRAFSAEIDGLGEIRSLTDVVA